MKLDKILSENEFDEENELVKLDNNPVLEVDGEVPPNKLAAVPNNPVLLELDVAFLPNKLDAVLNNPPD